MEGDMLFQRLLPMCIGAIIVCLVPAAGRAAEPLLPEISQVQVFRTDVVAAKHGAPIVGSPQFAHRDGEVVHYFANDDNCAEYVANARQNRPASCRPISHL
jgi:hypothetical protein